MTNPARLIPGALNVIDLDRWRRQSWLLSLIAARSWDGEGRSGAFISTADLAAHGRSPGGIRWDLELLARLADQRVVHRWPARRYGHVHVIRPPTDWRRVPWVPSRRAAMRYLLAYASDVAVVHSDVFPAQEGVGVSLPPQIGPSGAYGPAQITSPPATGTSLPATAQRPDQDKCGPQHHYPPQDGAGMAMPLGFTDVNPHSLQGREGGSEGANATLAALRAVLGRPVVGSMARRVAAVADAWADHRPELLGAVAGLAGVWSVRVAVEALESWQPAGGTPERPGVDRGALEQLLATRLGLAEATAAQGFEVDPAELAEIERLRSLLADGAQG